MALDPQNPPTSGFPSSDKTDKSEALDLLHQEDSESVTEEKEEEEEEEEVKKEEEEEEDEIKLSEEEEKEEEEEEKEEDLDLQVPVRRQEILKKYPNLFKEYPALERAYYKSQQYTELFGTIDDARESIAKAENFDKYMNDISSGDMSGLLKTVKEMDNESYAKLVDNYLPNLAKADQQAYYAVLGNIIRNTVISLQQEGDRQDNERLKDAALLLNQFVFGTSELPPPNLLSKQNQQSEAEKQLREKEEAFVRERYNTAFEDLSNRVSNVLKSTITQHIDPKEQMSGYVRKNAIRDATSMVENTIMQDTSFRKLMNNLWRKAFETNFSKKSLDTIRSAYLSKAKVVLPDAIKRARSEALKDGSNSRRVSNEGKPPINRGRSTSSSNESGKSGNPKEIPAKMSSLDYLMQD